MSAYSLEIEGLVSLKHKLQVENDKLRADNERLRVALKEIQRATSLEMLATNHGKSGDIANEIATRALGE